MLNNNKYWKQNLRMKSYAVNVLLYNNISILLFFLF